MTQKAERTPAHKIEFWTEVAAGTRYYHAKCRCRWARTDQSIGGLTGSITAHILEVYP